MRALLDTDVILDLFLNRQPFVIEAAAIWQANENRRFVGYVSAITPVNVFYIARKLKGVVVAQQAVIEIITALQVCPLDHAMMRAAMALPLKDYEDAVQHASAAANGLDAIITRNLADYAGANLPVLSPGDFLSRLP